MAVLGMDRGRFVDRQNLFVPHDTAIARIQRECSQGQSVPIRDGRRDINSISDDRW